MGGGAAAGLGGPAGWEAACRGPVLRVSLIYGFCNGEFLPGLLAEDSSQELAPCHAYTQSASAPRIAIFAMAHLLLFLCGLLLPVVRGCRAAGRLF